jgi:hypothetical protein
LNQAAPILHALPSDLRLTADFIRSVQMPDGAIPWYEGGKLDPWDHTEAAMALSIAGHWDAAERAYLWLARQQLEDGSWYANYFLAEAAERHSQLRETNFVAYVATGVWHHYLVTRDREFLNVLFPCVKKAVDFVVRYQTEHGDIAWAVDEHGVGQDDALVTACCSILRSLDCALKIAATLNRDGGVWAAAAARLKDALRSKPQRFDRTWESKARFSMDWYYPVLAGICSQSEAQARLRQRWAEFFEPDLGCRCVSDEPWVTMAETSELTIALVASGQRNLAGAVFDTLSQWRDTDGGYWTGYVFRDRTIWPAEKTTWTAGAVILAADALRGYSAAGSLFLQSVETGVEQV